MIGFVLILILFRVGIKYLIKGGERMDEALKTAMTTAFTGVKSDVLDIIGAALPIALAIVGVGLAITLGIKFFKKTSKSAG